MNFIENINRMNKSILTVAISLLLIGCNEQSVKNQSQSTLSMKPPTFDDFFENATNRDTANEYIDCEQLINYIEFSSDIPGIRDVLNYIALTGYEFRQCSPFIEDKRELLCKSSVGSSKELFFQKRVDLNGKIKLDHTQRTLCRKEITELISNHNEVYIAPTSTHTFFELIGQKVLFDPASITEVTWDKNDLFIINIDAGKKSYKLIFTDESKFNQALGDIKKSLPTRL